ATYSSREKPRNIEALRYALCEIFDAEDLDCVVLLYDVQIAVFFKTKREIDELYDLSIESMRISRLACQALSEDRLTIFHQPIFSNNGQCTQYVEALVRAPFAWTRLSGSASAGGAAT
ncbi:MAG: hypothetical protein P8101_23135, partial [Candidatus Thiodiazotropha sp.]